MQLRRPPHGLWGVGSRSLPGLAVLLLFVVGFLSLTEVSAAQDLAAPRAIANPTVDPKFINRQTLRSVFTLRVRTWPDGTPVHVFVLNDDDERHAAFCSDVLGTFPYILRRAWDRNLFSGTGLIPETVQNESEMLQKVADTPGGIGYLTQADDPDFRKRNSGIVIQAAPQE